MPSMVAVPVNAKLHPREVVWILENAGAKLAVVSAALADELKPLTPTPLIVLEEPDFKVLYTAPAMPVADVAPDDLVLAVLYVWHHRAAERRDADPP